MILCDVIMIHIDDIQKGETMEYKRTTITLQKSLFKKIMQLSEKEERSFNKQVIALLKKAIGDQITGTGKGGDK